MRIPSFISKRLRSAKGDIFRSAYIPAGQRLYVIGDIHGRADLLAATQAHIDNDLITRPCAQPIEVYLGDLIDRGPDSASVLGELIKRQTTHRIIVLSGNHERMLLEALDDDRMLALWLKHGGRETLSSYGLQERDARLADMVVDDVRALVTATIPTNHFLFIEALPYSYVSGDYFFAHAGIRPKVPLHAQTPSDLLWIREPFLSSNADHGLIVVHGHTPVLEPEFLHNRINIDTGAYLTGRLTCLVLEADTLSTLGAA
jgi:serine/threonine protein phosphatase 1